MRVSVDRVAAAVTSPSADTASAASDDPYSCQVTPSPVAPRSAGHAIVSASIQCARSSPVPASGGSVDVTVRTCVSML